MNFGRDDLEPNPLATAFLGVRGGSPVAAPVVILGYDKERPTSISSDLRHEIQVLTTTMNQSRGLDGMSL
jgi:hypothetical protein